MNALKGRPERPASGGLETDKPRRRAGIEDGALVKVTTRLTNRQARQMRVVAMQQGITIEDAYSDAVSEYLRRF